MLVVDCKPGLADSVTPEPSQAPAAAGEPSVEGRLAKIVHTAEDIARELSHGRIPVTDNVDALVALGFSRDRPQVASDPMWSRAVESADVRGGYKHQVIERAELVPPAKFAMN